VAVLAAPLVLVVDAVHKRVRARHHAGHQVVRSDVNANIPTVDTHTTL
jgi:hypothetical protein